MPLEPREGDVSLHPISPGEKLLAWVPPSTRQWGTGHNKELYYFPT